MLNRFFSYRKCSYLLVFLLVGPLLILGQTEQDIKRELEKRGINSLEEVQAELRKRGMSEADARRQARLYGINYDEYVQKYLLNKTDSVKTLNSIQRIGTDSIDYTQEINDRNAEFAPVVNVSDNVEEPESLAYFGYDIFSNNPYADQQSLI